MSWLYSFSPDLTLRMELVGCCDLSTQREPFLRRGVCCRGFLLQWMWLQYSGKSRPACSAACSAACSESDLLSSELSWAGALPCRCHLPCLLRGQWVKGWGSLSSLSTAEWWGQICTAACCPYPMSCLPGARCWGNGGEWRYITTTQRICFQVWAWCYVFHINKPGYDVFSLSIFLLSYKSSQLVDYYLSTVVVCKLCSILNGCFLSVHHKSVLFFLTTKDAVQGWILQRVCLI